MVERSFAAGVLLAVVIVVSGVVSGRAAARGGSLPPSVGVPSGFPGSSGPPREAIEASRAREARLRESWQSPASRQERERSRRRYKVLSRADARALGERQFPSVFLPRVWSPLQGVERRGEFLDSYSARVTLPGGARAVAVSSVPLRTRDDDGKLSPVDLDLVAGSGGLRPENPLVDTVIPARSSDPVRVGDIGFGLGGDAPVQVENDRAFYADAGGQDIDLMVMPTPSGVESFAQIRSVDAPEEVRMPFDLPAGTRLRSGVGALDAAVEIVRGDEVIATVSRPSAVDAQQRPVPVAYRVEGTDLVMTVAHRSGDFAMPIMLDPSVTYGWNENPRRYDATGWGAYQSNPASRWCSYFGDAYLGYGQYTFGRPDSNQPCASTSYTANEVYEWNYYGEFARGSSAFVAGWWEGYSFDAGWGGACRYSGVYSVVAGWEAFTGNECATVGNTTRYHAATGRPPNYAVFGTVIDGNGLHQNFTNHLWGATLYLSDRDDPTVEQGPRPIPTGWTEDTIFDVTARDPGLGVESTQVRVAVPNELDYIEGRSRSCSADPANHCPPSDTFSFATTSMPEGISTVSAQASDLIRVPDFTELATLKLDRSGPELSVGGTIPAADGGFAPNDATLTLSASDGSPAAPRSGVSYVDVAVNGVMRRRLEPQCAGQDNCALETQTWTFPDRAEGQYAIEVYAVDRAGNRSPTSTYTIRREESPPGLSLDGDLWAADGRVVSDAAYDLDITSLDGDEEDAESGMRSIEVLVEGARRHFVDRTCSPQGNCELETSFTFRPAEFSEGVKTIEILATDQHGNEVREAMAVDVRHIADLPADTRSLESGASLRFSGGQAGDRAGASVATIGDLNGDGLDDYVIGAPGADNNLRLDSGSAYVVYGSDGGGSVDLSNLGARGFRIDGAQPFDGAGTAVTPAGDVNGDGVPDVLVGAPQVVAPLGLSLQGRVYVVFGRATPPGVPEANLDLGQIGQQGRGFEVIGRQLTLGAPLQTGDRPFGSTLVGAPRGETTGEADVNGDDLDDIVIGAPMEAAAPGISDNRGAAYVVYGKATSQPVDTAQLGTAGYRIGGASPGDRAGSAAGIAGDVNGDGSADVAVGAPGRNAANQEGALYVALAGSGQDVDLATAVGSPNAYLVAGSAGDELGSSIAPVGDMDSDSLADVLVGGRRPAVVFGREASDSYSTTDALGGEQTYRLIPGAAEAEPGAVVADAGDLNRDGAPDVAMSLPGADVTYTVLSQVGQAARTGSTITLPSRPGQQGTRLTGPSGAEAIDGLEQAGGGQGGLLVGAPSSTGERGAAFVYPAGATTGGRTDPQAEAAASACYRNLNVARPFSPATFPACRLSLRKNRDQTPVSPRRGYKARGYPLTSEQRRGPNARKDVKRRLNKNQSEGDRRRWRLVDSLNQTVGWIEQLRGRHEFALYDDTKSLVDRTSPKSDLQVRLEGRPCMSDNATADRKALVVLYGSSSAGVNGRDVAFRAIIDRAAFPAEVFRNNIDNDRYIDGAWLTCGKRAGIGRFTKNPPIEPLEFPAPTTWRYQGGGTAGRARCNPTDPQCGSRYDNYAFPNLAAINQNPDPPNRPGVMPRTVTFSSSTTGVRSGAVVRGLVLEGTDVSRLDEFGYADDNASCQTPRRVRWRLVDANTTRTGGTQRLIGWSPEVLADTDPKAKAPRC